MFGVPSEGEVLAFCLSHKASNSVRSVNCLLTTPSSWTEFSCLGRASCLTNQAGTHLQRLARCLGNYELSLCPVRENIHTCPHPHTPIPCTPTGFHCEALVEWKEVKVTKTSILR